MEETSRKRQRSGCILAALATLVTLILMGCLFTSLVANVGAAGWAVWTQRQLLREEERTRALEAELERLLEILDEHDIQPPLAPGDVQLMDTIEGQVAAMRGLRPAYPVTRTLISQDTLREQTEQDFETDFTPDDARDYALALAAFDMVDPDLDMYGVLLRLYTEQIAGYYDIETEQVYVVADVGPMGQTERLTYAHEFVHVLQDQTFDLEGMGFSDDAEDVYDSEYLYAVRCLVEGDASLLENQFLATHFDADDVLALAEESLEIDMSVLDAVPDVLAESLFFPYRDGLAFVETLYESGGWAAVDAAYATPPLSTEHILHPERYVAYDEPQLVAIPPLTDTLGAGWRQVDEDVLGEYFTRYYLDQQIPADEAEAAAAGWGGDRYAVHYHAARDALALVFRSVWDTPGDAEEFVDAYVGYAEGRFGHAPDVTDHARMCWTGDSDALCMRWGSLDVTIALGPDVDTATRLLEAAAFE
ncbi:MAG: hypothetical protein JXD18_01610 [Anaerolineae bacterium]|nr:hypothetical protein [Anaerolineae bacterium]